MTELTTMGRFPAVRGCGCRICRPAHENDPVDRRCIETVLDQGWQVTVVGGGKCVPGCNCADDDGPAFAYTVGLMHRVGHPELAMSGQPPELMGHVLNTVAARVVAGHRLRPGYAVEGALPHVPLVVDEVSAEGLRKLGLWSRWFHRKKVKVLQLVWPTTGGIFGWQPGAPAELDDLQPLKWRVPSARTGAFAVGPPWPLPVPAEAMAVACVHVCQRGAAICHVRRIPPAEDCDEVWVFECGEAHPADGSEHSPEHLAHVVRSNPSIRQIANLELGGWADRPNAYSPWRRRRA